MANRPITAKTAWYDFVLDGIEASEVTYANDVLTVMDYHGKTAKRLAVGDIAGVDIEEGPLRNGLTITPKRGQAVKIAGLQKKESEQIRCSLQGRIRQIQAEEERRLNQEAVEKAKELKPEIISLDKHLRLTFNGQKFIRQSEATELAGSIRKLTNRLDARVRGQLDQAGKAALVRIDKLDNPQELERGPHRGEPEIHPPARRHWSRKLSRISWTIRSPTSRQRRLRRTRTQRWSWRGRERARLR